jgi:hypothetical protein
MQVNDIVKLGNDLLRQPMAPKYIQHDLQQLQKIYNEQIQLGQNVLAKLKVNYR